MLFSFNIIQFIYIVESFIAMTKLIQSFFYRTLDYITLYILTISHLVLGTHKYPTTPVHRHR